MKRLACEVCGSSELRKEGGVFICQSCGCQYDAEEVKKLMIEGTVSVDKSEDALRFLDLARSANNANNFKKAEDYASQVLEIDIDSYEAWFIQGIAIDSQASIETDRGPEALSCFKKALDIIGNKQLEAITKEDTEILEKLVDHLEEITIARCKLYTNPFKSFPSDKHKEYIGKIYLGFLTSYTTMLTFICAMSEKLAAKAEEAEETSTLETSSARFKEIESAAKNKIGHIYYDSARKINACVVASFTEWNENWKTQSIFDYIGGNADEDTTTEAEAFHNCALAYKNMITVLEYAIALMTSDSAKDYVTTSNYVVRAFNEVTNDDEDKLQELSIEDALFTFLSSRVVIAEADLNHRTSRRYHNAYHNGRVSDDGYTYNEEAKAKRLEQIAVYKRERDQYDPEERLAAQKREKIERYWKSHPDESNAKKDNEAKIAELSSEINELKAQRSGLGLFKGKEKAAIDEKISSRQAEIKKIEEKNKTLDAACDSWVSSH